MKPNELMIGDVVINPTTKEIGKISAIYFNKELDCLVATDGHSPQDHFEPVPITPQILEANGFVYCPLPFELFWERDGVILYEGGGGYYVKVYNNSIDVSYVHQIQHILHLLGNDSFQIKIP